MTFTYKGLPLKTNVTFIHNAPLAYRDAKLINALYDTPVGMLLEMPKAHLRRSLAKARLVCHWLEGILKLADKLETPEPKGE